MAGTLHVLGPQRPAPNLPGVLQALPGEGPLLLVSAGWRFAEHEQPDALARLGIEAVHLPLYRWFADIRAASPALDTAYAARQQRIREAKRLYQARLRHALEALAELADDLADDPALVQPEYDHALAHVRALDARYLETTAAIHVAYPEVARPWEHPAARGRYDEIRGLLQGARALLVAGGHVGVLLTRLRFFGLGDLIPEAIAGGTHVVAWSAGAMALSERVVLFYDDPPEGPVAPEVFDRGLGVLPRAVFLPHARRRLRVEDVPRVRRLAARFGPSPCVGLEMGAHLVHDEGLWSSRGDRRAALLLATDGRLRPVEDIHAARA